MVTLVKTKSVTFQDSSIEINEDSVVFFEATSRNEAIEKLLNHMSSTQLDGHREEFFQAVLEREKIASTGIGMGIAIPHAKLSCFSDFFLKIGILKEGVAWNAMDEVLVRAIFLIGGPDDKQSEYLSLLSQLTLYLRDVEKRKKLLTLSSPKQIIQLFES